MFDTSAMWSLRQKTNSVILILSLFKSLSILFIMDSLIKNIAVKYFLSSFLSFWCPCKFCAWAKCFPSFNLALPLPELVLRALDYMMFSLRGKDNHLTMNANARGILWKNTCSQNVCGILLMLAYSSYLHIYSCRLTYPHFKESCVKGHSYHLRHRSK